MTGELGAHSPSPRSSRIQFPSSLPPPSLFVAQDNLKMEGMCYRQRMGKNWGGLCGKQDPQSQLSPKRWPIKASRPAQGTKVPDFRDVAMSLLHCVPSQTREAVAMGADVWARDKILRSRKQMELESMKSHTSLALNLLVNVLITHRSLPVLRDLVLERWAAS